MSLKSMPVGYRFHPTDQELVNHYLKLKNQGSDRHVSNIQEIDVCKWEPWELPGRLGSDSDDQEWYFFGRRDSKYGKITRSNRATKDGYWKPTGKDRYIKTSSKKVIGTKKTLVFYKGRGQRAERTYWVMHEFRASADKYNPQAFVLYLLKKKSDENPEILKSDGTDPNRSSLSSSLLNNAPPSSPATPTVLQGSGNLSLSDQTRLSQNWKEPEVSSHAQNYPFDSTYLEDDIDLEALESCFDGQQATWEGLERMLPAIPSTDFHTNLGASHLTVRYLNVENRGVTHFQHIKRQEEAVNNIDTVSSLFMLNPETVPVDAESGTETDNDVPQSLFDEDAVYDGSAYHSDSESSDPEFYNDMILASEVSLSAKNSDVVRHVALKADKEDGKEPIFLRRVHEPAVNNPKTRTKSEAPAQASGKKEYSSVPLKKLANKIPEAGSDECTMESLIEAKPSSIHVARNESIGNNPNMGFIVYAENPRANNGTTPPSNYIMNIAVGILLTVVIGGEVLFGLVS